MVAGSGDWDHHVLETERHIHYQNDAPRKERVFLRPIYGACRPQNDDKETGYRICSSKAQKTKRVNERTSVSWTGPGLKDGTLSLDSVAARQDPSDFILLDDASVFHESGPDAM
ncbi:uncharacterized protein N7500_004919 [Penicillium coprophilum]|uniref:uncharacterized protein n=1 Tax=Penicillium coprophilum TaxID=36646 RepID=UPI00239838C1|nr:uncharacterized protein N7500_004919 [Penicillium coprophilum]KAJ5163089.1 hypothetical protein N7500_004919 [Penicillium coprophilum]